MKKSAVYISEAILLGFTLFTIIYNLCKNRDSFLMASIGQSITSLIALLIAFFATQYKTDERKEKEHVERLIAKLQEIVCSKEFYLIPKDNEKEETQKAINSMNRKVSNCLSVLSDYSKKFKFKVEFEYIQSQFNDYKATTGENISDLEYLSKSDMVFRRISDNIDSKCEEIIKKLYK